MAFIVVYDACVLHPAPVRDLLVRIANAGLVHARWSEAILDECFRSILTQRPDLVPRALDRTRRLMMEAVPDCLVTGHESLVNGLDLPDPGDRHVLAAAIRAGAQAIVTFNLKDFPADILMPYDIEAKHPDEFVMESLDLAPALVAGCLTAQAEALRNPPVSVPTLLETLRRQGLVQSVARLRDLLSPAGGPEA
jgi:hypothetical protein